MMKYLVSVLSVALVIVACTASKNIDQTQLNDQDLVTNDQPVIINNMITGGPDTTAWVAPPEVDSLKNPFKGDEEAIKAGELLYKRKCRSCHGRAGDGQGVGAADLSTPPADFTLPSFWEQSEGSIFWKIEEGRNDMTSFRGELDEEEIWQIITYIESNFKPQE